MTEWIEVNGARVEKSYLEENVREARSHKWTKIQTTKLTRHVHCMICGVAIDPGSSTTTAYESNEHYTCAYCHDHFLK
jgi:hypothetical protein